MKPGKFTIELSQQLRDSLSASEVPEINRLPVVVKGLNAIAETFPERYHWRFKTVQAFAAEFAELAGRKATAADLNAVYWRDTLATMEAYSVTAVWRAVDICQTAFRAVEEENVVPASILARSALESAVQFVHDARIMSATLDLTRGMDLRANVVINEDLEALLLQSVYASRLTGAEEIYKSRNILTVIDKVVKTTKDHQLKEQYELLCELTHPNFLGRSIYLAEARKGAREGEELRVVSHKNGANAEGILQTALWALSWSIGTQAASVHLLQGSIRSLLEAHPRIGNAKAAGNDREVASSK